MEAAAAAVPAAGAADASAVGEFPSLMVDMLERSGARSKTNAWGMI